MSKGSKQRPTDKDKFDANFDRIFGGKSELMQEAISGDLIGYVATETIKRLDATDGDMISMRDIRKARNAIFEGKK